MTRSGRNGSRFVHAYVLVFVLVLIFVLILISGVLTPIGPVSTSSSLDSAPTRLGTCSRITHSGRYVLTHDVETRRRTCLRIDADDVTLDGAGHVVDGHAFRENTTGIAVTGRNVTVRNATAINWTFGVRYENASDGTVGNVTTWRTGDGVSVSHSPRMHVARATATNGFTGIVLSDSNASTITDSVVRDTSSSGVFVSDSGQVSVTNVSVVRSDVGIALVGNRGGAVADAVVRSSGDSILLVDSRNNTIRNTTLTNPVGSAVVTRSNASHNRFVGVRGNWTTRDTPGTTTGDTPGSTTRENNGNRASVAFSSALAG